MLIGLVGKPNVGKSTFFKACTLADVAIANYPFTTIQANEGVGFVKVDCVEANLGVKCKPNYGFCIKGERFVPVKLIDVAGLVPGAHEGKGRGNEFLDDLREADCLIHILDVSGKTDEGGNFTENYDVSKDVSFLVEEIDMWIFQILTKNWKTLTRKAKVTNPVMELHNQLSGLKIKEENIKKVVKNLNLGEDLEKWKEEDILNFAKEIRKISKPIIIAANKIDVKGSEENLKKLKEKFPELLIIPCSAESELALREAARDKIIDYVSGEGDFKITGKVNENQKKALEFIREKIMKKWGNTGVQNFLNEAVFSYLKFIVVYPVENEHKFCDSKGNILPDAYLLPSGSTALDLAFHIHTDIGNKFVSAVDCKTGKRIGKETKLKNNDVVKIMTR